MPSTASSPRARLAGALYLAIIVLGVWSEGFVRSALIVPGDAAASAAAILDHVGLFRMSIAADAVMAVCDVALAVVLYVILKPLGRTLALSATAFRLVQSAIIGVNLLLQHGALVVLLRSGDDAASADLALMLMELQGDGYDLGLVFFGVNCLLVGWLIWRAPSFPRALGAMISAAGAVYLVGSALVFLAPEASPSFEPLYLVPLLAESALCMWLLIKGRDVDRAVLHSGSRLHARAVTA